MEGMYNKKKKSKSLLPTQSKNLQKQKKEPDAGEDASKLKVLMIGDSGVGKTSLLGRFTEDVFSESFLTTIGVDFKIKPIELEEQEYTLHIWDTSGQERFREITSKYYASAKGIMLVYDVRDDKSFHNITDIWMRLADRHASPTVKKILVANKSDSLDRRVIDFERGKALADEYNIPFLEVSAKSSVDCDKAFLTLAQEITNKHQQS